MAALEPGASKPRRSENEYVGEYRRLESIGQGSFAIVYRAVHPQGTLVAMKSVSHTKLKGKLKANLFSEIDILKSVKHPHIVALIDLMESRNHVHIIMELGWLGDLALFMKKRDRLHTEPATAELARRYPSPPGAGVHEVVARHFSKQLASALEYLRSMNLVHRDLKPQNLLLSPSPMFLSKMKPEDRPFEPTKNASIPVAGVLSLPILKIADFGFARVLEKTSLAETLCGSPLYMAPEILRYEKYDTKADLWSVGAILYELMAGRPPFRAANHVDLLRKIERAPERVAFPKELLAISDDMKKIIRALMRKLPTERIGWEDYFQCAVNRDEIPGLAEVDRPRKPSSDSLESGSDQPERLLQRNSSKSKLQGQEGSEGAAGAIGRAGDAADHPDSDSGPSRAVGLNPQLSGGRVQSQTPPGTSLPYRASNERSAAGALNEVSPRTRPAQQTRPALETHDTAPHAPVQKQERNAMTIAATAMERRRSQQTFPSNSVPKEHAEPEKATQNKDERVREKAAQDIAFERDYVMVEKRAVEVNAFADELAASPQVQRGQRETPTSPTALVRRATTQGAPSSTSGTDANRQMPPPSRPETHNRKPSYERRYGPNPNSVTSMLGKALNSANLRLFGAGFPITIGATKGSSPPQTYGAFPVYPASNASYSPASDIQGRLIAMDEDSRIFYTLEDTATISDVVFGFAEVKYKQLVPISPSNGNTFGRGTNDGNNGSLSKSDDGLTPAAIVEIAEEALVLYVKALAILNRTFDMANNWLDRRKRNLPAPSTEPSSLPARPGAVTTGVSSATANKINNVVQWCRNRFNECLEKSEFVARKLEDAQKKLPRSHDGHPSNFADHVKEVGSRSAGTLSINISSGITAEKLMYDRAIDMSQESAESEMAGGNLVDCERSYVTAIRLMEAVLFVETDEEHPRKNSGSRKDSLKKDSGQDPSAVDGIDDADRKSIGQVIDGMRARTRMLRQKMNAQHRNSLKMQSPSPEPSTAL